MRPDEPKHLPSPWNLVTGIPIQGVLWSISPCYVLVGLNLNFTIY